MDSKSWLIGITILISITAISLFLIPNNKQEQTQSADSIELALPQEMNTQSPATTTASPQPQAMDQKTYTAPPKLQIDLSASYQATMQTSVGALTIELFTNDAPNTVNNFIFLSNEGFYNNTVFHRIIKDFMVQGGDPKGDGTGDPGYKFKDEPVTRSYDRGIMAMANSGPNTNGSQFFIMTQDNPSLPKNYTIFGQVTGDDSFKTLDAIASTPVTANQAGEKSKPLAKVSIQSIKIEKVDAQKATDL